MKNDENNSEVGRREVIAKMWSDSVHTVSQKYDEGKKISRIVSDVLKKIIIATPYVPCGFFIYECHSFILPTCLKENDIAKSQLEKCSNNSSEYRMYKERALDCGYGLGITFDICSFLGIAVAGAVLMKDPKNDLVQNTVFGKIIFYNLLFCLTAKAPTNCISAVYEGSRSWYLSTKKKMEEERVRKTNSIEDTLS